MDILLLILAMLASDRVSIDADAFPLSVSGHYLQDSRGRPFPIQGDTVWSIEVQCSEAQIDTILDDRAARGFTAIAFEYCEALHSSQTPAYRNVDGNDPFTVMSPVNWVPATAYKARVEYVIAGCRRRGMVAIVYPAYFGFNGLGADGWKPSVDAASDAALFAYGVELGALEATHRNVIWCMGGDNAADSTSRGKQAKIADGIRSVVPASIITAHPKRSDGDAATYWGEDGDDYSWFGLNFVYTSETDIVAEALSAYDRGMPVLFGEGRYEGEPTIDPIEVSDCIYQQIQAMLSGCCGFMFANNPLWGLGSLPSNGGAGAQDAIDNYLDTPGARGMTYVFQVLKARQWGLLVPTVDTSLVTTALGSGAAATCPALSSTGRLAIIGKNNSAGITVDFTAFTPALMSSRWLDPTDGSWHTPVEGLNHANSGTQAYAHPGNNAAGGLAWMLVIDEA